MRSGPDFDHEAAFNQERQRGVDIEVLEEIGYRWPPLTVRAAHQVVAEQVESVFVTPRRTKKEQPLSRKPRYMEIRDRRPDLQPFPAGTADMKEQDLTGIAALGLKGVRERNAERRTSKSKTD